MDFIENWKQIRLNVISMRCVGHEVWRKYCYSTQTHLLFAFRPRTFLVIANPNVCAHLCTYARVVE